VSGFKIKLVQELLKDNGVYRGKIDGDFGKLSREAVRKYYDFPLDWNDSRLVVGCIQVICIKNGFSAGIIDGFWGQFTEKAYNQLLTLLGKKEKSIIVSPNADTKKSYNKWPRPDYDSMVRFYGKVGTNQTTMTLPYEMELAWDSSVKIKRFTCHMKVKDAFGIIFEETLKHYGKDAIKELQLDSFGGCLNVRKMRGGSSWSKHSWGCAYDLDPDRNRLKWGRDSAYFAKPEYKPYWDIVESQGGKSLGILKNYDWMHVEMTD